MNMEIVDKNSLEARSEDVVGENIRRLGDLFPELLTEGPAGPSVNVDVLKQLVGDGTVSETDEKYGLSWFGKRNARQIALTPSLGTLLPRPEASEDWDDTKNLMIEGDNLEVLKLLQKSYSGKVKLIYIDPPYNTGKDFVYPDTYQDNIKNYLELTGQTNEGQKTISNTESSGRFHTDWLNMMYPRLKLARNLLSEDGVIFISIDDSEFDHLKEICDEIFGESNFCGVIKRRAARKTAFLAKRMTDMCDYVVVYGRSDSVGPLTEGHVSDGTRPVLNGGNKVTRRFVRAGAIAKCPDGNYPEGQYGSTALQFRLLSPLVVHEGKVVGDVEIEGPWRISQAILDDSLFITRNFGLRRVMLVEELDSLKLLNDLLDNPTCYNEAGSEDLSSIMSRGVFSNPKPTGLIRYLISAVTMDDNDIILDFFAGSGTTGQAVMEQNALDGGNRKFILVQLPEPLLETNKEQEAALAFCREHNLEENIAALTAERLRRAGAKVRSENPMFAGDVGFRVFKLAESNIRAWNPLAEDLEGTLRTSEDHLVEGRSELDVLYEILLKRGLDLCTPIETKEIASHLVNAVGGGVLFACLDGHIAQANVEALAEGIVAWRQELGVVGDVNCIFRDSAFDNDVAKTNMSSILEQAGFTKIQSL